MKHILLAFCTLFIFGCKSDTPETKYQLYRGKTMGTTFSIKLGFMDQNPNGLQAQIDSILLDINQAVSTYIPSSIISRINTSDSIFVFEKEERFSKHFIRNYDESLRVFKLTQGYFDPSIMPLVNYWGFGYEGKEPVTHIDSQTVERLTKLVGLNKFTLNETVREEVDYYSISKRNKEMSLDFSAIAKGYAVDYIAEYLRSKAVLNYMVEIGGEVKVLGFNQKGLHWKIGINTPLEEASLYDLESVITPKNKSMASSGNYRIFYETGSYKYGHEINPISGFPEITDLLSASVIHESCMRADAVATACMILGLEKSLKLINEDEELEACFIISKGDSLEMINSNHFIDFIAS